MVVESLLAIQGPLFFGAHVESIPGYNLLGYTIINYYYFSEAITSDNFSCHFS